MSKTQQRSKGKTSGKTESPARRYAAALPSLTAARTGRRMRSACPASPAPRRPEGEPGPPRGGFLEEARRGETSRELPPPLDDLRPEGRVLLNRSGAILDINATGCQILHRARQGLIRRPFVSLVAEAYRGRFQDHLLLCAQHKATITTEVQMEQSGARPAFWLELTSLAAPAEGIEPGVIRCVFVDISARVEVEEALRESEARFRDMADAAPVMIWVSGPDRECTYFSRPWLEFTGRSLAQELGSGWTQDVHPDDLKRCLKSYTASFDRRKPFRIEYRLLRHDGEYRWVLDHGVPRFSRTNQFRGYIGSCVDITERKRTESALKMQSRFPRENPSPVIRLEKGRILNYANPAARKLMTRWGVSLGDEAPEAMTSAALLALAQDRNQVREMTVGSRAFQIWFAPVCDADYVNCYFSDITQRQRAERALRQAFEQLEDRVLRRTRQLTRLNAHLLEEIDARRQVEEALRQSEQQYRMILEGTRDYAICLLDAEGRVATWNSGAESILGHRAKEILGQPFSRFYPRADVSRGKPEEMLLTARTAGRAEDEGWRIRKNGSAFWASTILTALRDKRRRLCGFLEVMRDITERRQAQEALQSSERKLADFFDEASLAFLWVGPRGQIRRVNRAGLELLGCATSNCVGRSLRGFCVAPAAGTRLLTWLTARRSLQNERLQLRRPDGTVRHVVIDANGLWEFGRLVHSRWVVRDVTRRVELQREIIAAAERERQRIGRDLHDDLCQQLTGIEFLSQTLAGGLRSGNGEHAARAREIAGMVRNAITRTRELAHGLAPMELETMGLAGALQALSRRTRKVAGIDCRFRCRAAALPLDCSDPVTVHLYRIAQEAVANALKHARAKHVEISLRRNGRLLTLAVKDDGVGLPARLRSGTGAGLRGLRYRAELIGGAIVFESRRGGGTTVTCSVSEPPSSGKALTTL